MQNLVLYLFILFIAFIVGIFITRWIFRIDEIVDLLKENNRLLSAKKQMKEQLPNIVFTQDEPEIKETNEELHKSENDKLFINIFFIVVFVVAIIIIIAVNTKK